MWLSKKNLSIGAYRYCKDVADDPKIRKYINEKNGAHYYCRDIKNDPTIRRLVKYKWRLEQINDLHNIMLRRRRRRRRNDN